MDPILQDRDRVVWHRYGFKNLLVWLLVYLVVGPFLERMQYASEIASVFLTVALISAVYAVNRQSHLVTLSVSLMALTLCLLWLERLGAFAVPRAALGGLLAVYLGTLAYSFLRHLLAVPRVNGNVICAALCLYLVLGLLWGAFYQILDALIPGAFAGGLLEGASGPQERVHALNYFSFVTLSTLGYGDILPQTPDAAALCQTEAIVGQFFTVALVARLVGLEVAQDATRDRGED